MSRSKLVEGVHLSGEDDLSRHVHPHLAQRPGVCAIQLQWRWVSLKGPVGVQVERSRQKRLYARRPVRRGRQRPDDPQVRHRHRQKDVECVQQDLRSVADGQHPGDRAGWNRASGGDVRARDAVQQARRMLPVPAGERGQHALRRPGGDRLRR